MGRRVKTILISVVLIVGAGYAGLVGYILKTNPITFLIINASDGENKFIPQPFYEYALIHFRGDKKDVADLVYYGGLNFILRTKDVAQRDRLMKFFIARGLGVNDIIDDHGLTMLHSSILGNEIEHVQYLLSLGADPMVRDTKWNLTALEYLEFIDEKSKARKLGIDRSEIKSMLLEYHKKMNEAE